jgi:hypothetical protein
MPIDPETPYRAAQQLWSPTFTGTVLKQLEAIEGLDSGISMVSLASTLPTNAARTRLHEVLRKFGNASPQPIEDAGLGEDIFCDPGFLVVMKLQPRKDPQGARKPRANRSGRKWGSRSGGETAKPGTGGPGGPGAPGGPSGSGSAGAQPAQVDPPVAWMEATENLMRAMCDRFNDAGKRATMTAGLKTAGDAQIERALEIPNKKDLKIVSEYRVDWPDSLPGKQKLAGVAAGPMTVYYAKFETKATPANILTYYGSRAGGKSEPHLVEGGYWLDVLRVADESGQRASVDVLITKKGGDRDVSKAAAKPGTGTGPGGYPSSTPGGTPSGPSSSPYPGGPGGPSGAQSKSAIPSPAEKSVSAELVVELLFVSVPNPAPLQEKAKPKTKEEAE